MLLDKGQHRLLFHFLLEYQGTEVIFIDQTGFEDEGNYQ